MLGSLHFNIFINGLFYFFDDADDATLHACDNNMGALIERLERSGNRATEWFKHIHMKLNPDKCGQVGR